MTDKDSDMLLLLAGVFVKQDKGLHETRREVFCLLVEEAWKVAMRSHHYLITQCMDTPCDSSWMLRNRYQLPKRYQLDQVCIP
ncbi:Hypothetical protein PHPALM_609 [Phytophthora palmivora]|uniref:Uncharacterized protein n=1 Tax=Phytophthora palmivora TaxID=4796 RepID=A0A2P4YUD6_9STRA|nr:Hypothetical protein PHPALM_609 [Phytophthora palmivora]